MNLQTTHLSVFSPLSGSSHLASALKLPSFFFFCRLVSHRDIMLCSIRRKTVMVIIWMWSVQKFIQCPLACNILQAGRVKRVRTPISIMPKTPNPPPPRGRQTHTHKKTEYSLLCHYFLKQSPALFSWLFSAVYPPTLNLFSSYVEPFTHFRWSLLHFWLSSWAA